MSNTRTNISIIKPDAVERNLDNEIKKCLKTKDFQSKRKKNSNWKIRGRKIL